MKTLKHAVRRALGVPGSAVVIALLIVDMLLYRAFARVRPPDGPVNATFRSATGESKAG